MSSTVKSPDRPRRREPVQARSRDTVARILDAAAALIDDSGVDAVTTRAIVERAGLTAPSLYRFFADRDQILDALVERHIDRLETFVSDARRDWSPTSPTSLADFVAREFGAHAEYYERHPSAARLWLDGRVSAIVRAEVMRYHRTTAHRLQEIAVSAGLLPADPDVLAMQMAVELADRILELAFRERSEPDAEVLEQGRIALTSYLEAVAGAR